MKDLDATIQSLVGTRSREVLSRMQKALLSATLNIAQTLKIVTLKDNHKAPDATDFSDFLWPSFNS